MYLVTITLPEGMTIQQVQEVLSSGHSWYRVTPSAWLLCTDEGSNLWHERLTAFGKNGSLLIMPVVPCIRKGFQSKDFWNWVQEHEKCFKPAKKPKLEEHSNVIPLHPSSKPSKPSA